MGTAVAAVCLLLLLLLLLMLKIHGLYSKECIEGWRAIYEKTIKKVGFSMSPTRIGETESNPCFFRAKSATFNAPSTDTVLGRDPDMRRNIPTGPLAVPTAPLLAPQPKREKEPSADGEQHA